MRSKKEEGNSCNRRRWRCKNLSIPYGSRIKVTDGEVVEAGDEITEGSVNPHDILKIKGMYRSSVISASGSSKSLQTAGC